MSLLASSGMTPIRSDQLFSSYSQQDFTNSSASVQQSVTACHVAKAVTTFGHYQQSETLDEEKYLQLINYPRTDIEKRPHYLLQRHCESLNAARHHGMDS